MKKASKTPHPRKKWHSPSDFDYLFLGFLVIMVIMMSLSKCNGQACDSLQKQNTQLRNAIKTLPTEEILDLFATYDRLLKDCETTKDKIIQTTTKTLSQNTEQLHYIQQLLAMSNDEVKQLKKDITDTKNELSDIQKNTKKARRQIFFERIGTVILSSVATIVIYTLIK